MMNSAIANPRIDASQDFNGDGTRDLLLTLPQKDLQGFWVPTIQLLNGKNGKRIWGPITFEGQWQFDHEIKSPLIRDLDGDSRFEIVLLESMRPRISVLRGDTGETLWNWQESHNGHSIASDLVVVEQRSDRADQPQNETRPRIQCVATTVSEPGKPTEIISLDHMGAVIERVPHPAERLWSYDLDGDGQDELLRMVDNQLQATRGLRELLWAWSPPNKETFQVSYCERSPDQRAVVAVLSTDSLLMLDGPTGKPLLRTRRRCNTIYQTGQRILELNHPKQNANGGPRRLVTCSGDGPPLIDQIVSREILPTSNDGRYASAGLHSRLARSTHPLASQAERTSDDTANSATANGATSGARQIERATFLRRRRIGDDPRLTRQLPWAPAADEGTSFWGRVLQHVAIAITMALAIVVIPYWLIHAGIGRRELGWWRGTLIVAGFGVAALSVFLVQSLTASPAKNGFPLVAKLAMAIGALPMLAWPWALIQITFGGHWRRLAWLLGSTLAAAIIIALKMISTDSVSMLPEQHYSMHGWWFIGFIGAYAIGWLLIAWRILGPGLQWLKTAYLRKLGRYA